MAGVSFSRVAWLRRIPAARLIALAELAVLVRDHYWKLEPQERRRVLELLRRTHGRPANLTRRERAELAALVAKTDPRLFVENAVHRVTGLSLPGGNKRRRPFSR